MSEEQEKTFASCAIVDFDEALYRMQRLYDDVVYCEDAMSEHGKTSPLGTRGRKEAIKNEEWMRQIRIRLHDLLGEMEKIECHASLDAASPTTEQEE